MEIATFAGGCFWCTEAIFQRIKGVESVQSGYIGGKIPNPTYDQVSMGTTGHAEAIQITYDPDTITYSTLLEVFWKTHDPTTLNRQGNDVGTQYRSAIFYHDEQQKKQAESMKKKLESEHIFDNPIVTEIVPATEFYPAEEYHKNYYNQNREASYCQLIIDPKVNKLMEMDVEKK